MFGAFLVFEPFMTGALFSGTALAWGSKSRANPRTQEPCPPANAVGTGVATEASTAGAVRSKNRARRRSRLARELRVAGAVGSSAVARTMPADRRRWHATCGAPSSSRGGLRGSPSSPRGGLPGSPARWAVCAGSPLSRRCRRRGPVAWRWRYRPCGARSAQRASGLAAAVPLARGACNVACWHDLCASRAG
jgi:hypothetical protein